MGSVFRGDMKSESLGTHFYPKMEVKDGKYSCWITFLGAHGHCEAHDSRYDLYNTDDTPEGYAGGSGSSAENCLARADWWMKYCDTPVLATYVPDGVTSQRSLLTITTLLNTGRAFTCRARRSR